MDDLDPLLQRLTETMTNVQARVARLERLESPATDGTGPFVLKAGDVMPGPDGLTISAATQTVFAAEEAMLLLTGAKPSDPTPNYYYLMYLKNLTDNLPWMSFRADGVWVSATNLNFDPNKGPASQSGAAMMRFPPGGLDRGDIEIDTFVGSGTIRAIHFYPRAGGATIWGGGGVAATAVNIILDSSHDVVRGLRGEFVVYDSAATLYSGLITPAVAPGGTFDLVNDGTNILRLTVAANGSVTIARAGGSRTYDVVLKLIWI